MASAWLEVAFGSGCEGGAQEGGLAVAKVSAGEREELTVRLEALSVRGC